MLENATAKNPRRGDDPPIAHPPTDTPLVLTSTRDTVKELKPFHREIFGAEGEGDLYDTMIYVYYNYTGTKPRWEK